jgi:serine/threonine protein kinase
MRYACSACNRSFAEPGFCPYDATKLVESDAHEVSTLGSSAIKAVSAADSGTHGEALDSIRRRVSEYDRLIGETLDGRYLVQRKIGEGGMGVVFAVKHTVIERPLAIKVLKKKVMRDQGTVQRFIQEARAASRIGHPNIVDVTDFGKTDDGTTYQVMELIDGMTLSRVIKSQAPLPLERVLRIATQIARALAAAHGKGIVHRDLKPENVFLIEREGRPDFVKIVDFGIAKVAPIDRTAPEGPRLTRAGSVFGTPEYMAPEQAAGRNDTDHRVDIYALGVIIYEMLTGKTPHKGDSTVQTIAMQMLDPIVPPSQANPAAHVPSDLEAVDMKALAKDRDQRYQTMTELLQALDDIPTEAHTVPDLQPPVMPPAATTVVDAQPRRAKPPTRPLHEPQFVATQANMTFDHVYADPAPDMERTSKVPMIVAGLVMLLLGAGGAVFLIMKLRGNPAEVATSPRQLDAAVIAEVPQDASVADVTPDAADVIAEVPVDAGVKATQKHGPGTIGARPDRKGNVTIEVLTRPGDANVYIDKNYRGPSGVRITEKYGAKLKIVCKTDNKRGSVEVVFDGSLNAIMCNAIRDRFCVPGLKNPYDECEDDPNALP